MINLSNKILDRQVIFSLQAVRAIAFLGIFTSHCDVSTLGAWGTSVFIMLSGFLLMYRYYDKNLDTSLYSCIKFSASKIKKLYPLHILMTLAALVLSLYLLTRNFVVKQAFWCLGQLILNVALLQAWMPSSSLYFSLNAVAWYLSLCTFLYAIFPLLLKLVKKLHSTKKIILFAALIYIAQNLMGYASSYINVQMQWADNIQKWITYICPLFRAGDFALGVCAGYFFVCRETRSRDKIQYNVVSASVLEVFLVLAICATQFIYKYCIGAFL